MTAWMNYVKQYAKDTTEKGIPSGKPTGGLPENISAYR